ncbi:hypothetical protein GOBAR_AA05657 [Gossypium barbadense]|uniref:Uncharacterized protein n=1 Tax=Gossypium barbadense TaxID=3634 RepID=A0A2P5YH74_GOSBA|nr:hypothetical protein GOBAR_AA05657 [Gossypium barbadense]
MSFSRGKKVDVSASKKRKGASSSSGPTAKVRYPFLRFPIGPQEELFQILWGRPLITGHCIDWASIEQVQLAEAIQALLTTDPWELFFGIIEATYLELSMELCSTFHLQTVMINYDDLGTTQFRLGRLVHQLSVPEFGTALGLYMEEFKEENDLDTLNSHIHHSPSQCWDVLVPGRRESTGIVNTHEVYFLWCTSYGYVIDLSYFIAFTIQHQTERHRKGVISIGPYEEAYEDIPDDVPPQHEDPPSQPPLPSRPVHAAASYADISERLTQFKQHCFQRFDNIDATLQQICQHLHISSLVPRRESSSDEDV